MCWANLPLGGTIRSRERTFRPQPAEDSFLPKHVLVAAATRRVGCADRGVPSGTNGDGCATQQQRSLNNSDSEDLIVLKIDHTINTKDSVWYRFQRDTGLQAEWTDPIDSIFNCLFAAAAVHLVAGYTHLFSRRW